MSLTVPDEGKSSLLSSLITNKLNATNIKLFTNNYTPDHTSVAASFVEAAWTGYAQVAMAGWSAPAATGDFHYTTTANPAVFSNTSVGAQVCYGYYMVDATGKVIGAERFAGAPLSIPSGNTLTVTVTYTDQSEF